MKWLRYSIAVELLVLCTATAHAGSDPIGWSLSANLPAQTNINEVYSGYTYTIINNMPFTMPSPLYIKKKVNGEFTVTDNCSGLKLASRQTCTVSFNFAPTSNGNKTLDIALEYDSNIVWLPTVLTTASTNTTLITGTVTTPLPATMGLGQQPANVLFTFVNNGAGTVNNVTDSHSYPAGFTPGTNSCTAMTTFGPGASCSVAGTFTTNTPGTYTVGYTLTYTGGQTALSTSTVASQDVTAAATTPLPANISTGTPTPVVFTFKNNGNGTITGITPPVINATPDGFTYTNNCTSPTLGAGQSCTVTGSLNADMEQDYSITATFNYTGGSVSAMTNTTASIGVTGMATGPTSVSAGSANNYTFTFTNNGTGTITGITAPTVNTTPNNSDFVPTNNCTSTTLQVGHSCTVTGVLTPSATGPYAITVTFNYSGGQVPVTENVTSAQAINGTVTTELPTDINIGLPATPAAFTFTNTGSTTVTGVTAPTVTPSGGTYNYTTTNCSGSLSPSASCTISGTFTAPTTGNYTIDATFNYAGPAVPLSTSTDATGRLFTIINNCTTQVWFSFNGAAISPSPTCASDTDCPTGSSCDTGNSTCYWTNPVPTSGSLNLQPGAQTSLILPDANTATTTVWQGNIAAQTQCNGTSSCVTGDCQSGGGSTSCAVGATFNQPATVAQLALVRNANDTYSVNASGGVNVGLAIDPLSNTTPSAYTCGNPGSATPNNLKLTTLGACTWTAANTTPAMYTWVQAVASPTACTDNTSCTAPQVCGLSYSATPTPTFQQTCGPQLGYWTANTACSLNAAAADSFFSCNTALTNTAGTLTDLYACDSQLSGSCYAAGAIYTCCGCQNWDQTPTFLPVPASPTTPICNATNSDWTNHVRQNITWLKTACPTALAYPDDTGSTTFTCATTGSTTNATSYTITFCPTAS